jgi:nitrogen fixation/metabolism regulation signal transduction histidine kinase
MSDQPRKKRPIQPRKRGKREQPARKRNVSADALKEISAHLPDKLQSFVRELFQNQAELEKENKRIRSSQANLHTAHIYSKKLLDAVTVGMIAMDKKGIILESNLGSKVVCIPAILQRLRRM